MSKVEKKSKRQEATIQKPFEAYLPFISAYISTNNITEASRQAGIARSTATRWLKSPEVRQMLIDQRNAVSIRVDVTAMAVLQELKGLAFSNIEDYVNQDGTLKKISDMPNTGAIQELSVTDKVNHQGQKERTVRIKLVDKLTALKQISDNLNLFANNQTIRPTVINFNNTSTEELRKLILENTIDITQYQEE